MFSRFAKLLNFVHLGSHTDFTTNGVILEFSCRNVLRFAVLISAWTEACENRSIVFFGVHELFSVDSLSGILVCSSIVSVISAKGFVILVDEFYERNLTLLPVFVRLLRSSSGN